MRSICWHAARDGLPMASEGLINVTGTDGIKVFPKRAPGARHRRMSNKCYRPRRDYDLS
jgi:hypothetical protein